MKSKIFFLILFIWFGHLFPISINCEYTDSYFWDSKIKQDEIFYKSISVIQKKDNSTKKASQRLKKRKQRGLKSSICYVALKFNSKVAVSDNYLLRLSYLFLHKNSSLKTEGRAPPIFPLNID